MGFSSGPLRKLAGQACAWHGLFFVGRLAQLVEHFVYTEGVGGSNPSPPTIQKSSPIMALAGRMGKWRCRADNPVH
jgi:hypothetical protein